MNTKKIKHMLSKTDNGFPVGDGIVLLFTILVVAILVIISMVSYTNLTKKDNVTMVARQCIIAMETQGGLTQDTKDTFTRQLENVGVSDISFNEHAATADEKTTYIDESNGDYAVPYGNMIVLHVSGKLKIKQCTANGFHLTIQDEEIPIDVMLTSTSKC